jgi:DNA-binding NarL/FixJ family response regulator
MSKVLIADDSEIMRSAIVSTLGECKEIAVIGEASSFPRTIQMVSDLKPAVLLLDLHMPGKREVSPSRSNRNSLACAPSQFRFQQTKTPKS